MLYLFICRCIKQNIMTLKKQNYYLLFPTCLPKSKGVKERRENMDYGLSVVICKCSHIPFEVHRNKYLTASKTLRCCKGPSAL